MYVLCGLQDLPFCRSTSDEGTDRGEQTSWKRVYLCMKKNLMGAGAAVAVAAEATVSARGR
jgi:hypothetical protein